MRKTKVSERARVHAWVWMWAAALLVAASCGARVLAQGEAPKGAPATVAGRVTDGRRGLAGVPVVLMANYASPWSSDTVSTKTDAEGRYRVSGLAPGRYQVVPVAPAFVVSEGIEAQRSRTLQLAPGETVESVDFRLTRGGVITGRVTGADGKPLVGEFVRITVENSPRPAHTFMRPDRTEFMTDDRGVYRVYGLAAGRYTVSVGSEAPPRNPRQASTSGERTYNQRTFYPSTTDPAQAKPVEVTEGGETTDIDISVAKTTKQTYTAAGRIVFADTGQPAANVRVSYTQSVRGTSPLFNFGNSGFGGPGGFSGVVTDARGEFKLEGLVTGHYVAFAVRDGNPDWYGEQALFEINESDAEGIEVKLRRGASLSGVVQLEGVSDRASASRVLSRARLFAIFEQPGGGPPMPGSSSSTTVNPDGSFTFKGLQPGRVRLGLGGDRDSGVVMVRVEHNGADAMRGIDVAEGAQVTGVRVVGAHGSAVVRGQVNVTGEPLPAGWSLRVMARRLGAESPLGTMRTVEADSRGHFVLENLVAGEYEFYASAFFIGARGGGPGGGGGGGRGGPGGGGSRGLIGPKQRVSIAPNSEQTLTLVLPVNENANQ